MRNRIRRQSGGAYLISLLVMLVLTLMGLALTTLTQTELLIGANERQIQRLFFAADAGRAASTAKALIANAYEPYEFELAENNLWAARGSTVSTRHVVAMSAFFPVQSEICDLCDSANDLSERENPLNRIVFSVGSTATRLNDFDSNELGRKTIGTMVDLHPLDTTIDSLLAETDETTGEITFDGCVSCGSKTP